MHDVFFSVLSRVKNYITIILFKKNLHLNLLNQKHRDRYYIPWTSHSCVFVLYFACTVFPHVHKMAVNAHKRLSPTHIVKEENGDVFPVAGRLLGYVGVLGKEKLRFSWNSRLKLLWTCREGRLVHLRHIRILGPRCYRRYRYGQSTGVERRCAGQPESVWKSFSVWNYIWVHGGLARRWVTFSSCAYMHKMVI